MSEHQAVDYDYLADRRPACEAPEVALWRAVIFQACQDAHHGPEPHRTTARAFLAGKGLVVAMELALLPVEQATAIRDWKPERVTPAGRKHGPDRRQFVEWHGERLTRSELARRYGLNPVLVNSRLTRGWTLGQALGLAPKPTKPAMALLAMPRGYCQ